MSLFLAALLTTSSSGWAGNLSIHPVRGEGPVDALATRGPAVLAWSGGAADVEAQVGNGWQRLATAVQSPWTSPPLADGARLRVVRTLDGSEDVATLQRVWTPADVAAWSGPGLRGLEVTALAPVGDGLWVATRGGGLAWWDGQRWSHLDRRVALPDEAPLDLAVQGTTRWVACATDLIRLDADGSGRRWTASELGATEVRAVTPAPSGGVWVTTDAGVWAVDGDTVVAVLVAEGCTDVLLGGTEPVAACAPPRALPGGAPLPGLESLTGLTALVPRVDGAWLGTSDRGLLAWVGGVAAAGWSPAQGEVRDVARIETSMLVAAGVDGAWLIREDTIVDVPVAAGVPDGRATAVAPGPRTRQAWLGTEGGVALVSLSGAATPLPMAPLPAGAAIRVVRPTKEGLVVASSRGLVWLGRRPPRAWSTLVAAAGPGVLDVLGHDGDWWALGADAAWRLDRRGRLERFELGAAGIALAWSGLAVAVATDLGVRWWLPGAAMLSSVDRVDDLRAVQSAGSGALWRLGPREVSLAGTMSTRTWAVPGVRAMSAAGAGAVLATDRGLAWLAATEDAPVWGWSDTATGAMRAVDATSGRVWAVGEDGRVWVGTEEGPRVVPLPDDAQAHGVVADPTGAWILTVQGLYRLSVPGRSAL